MDSRGADYRARLANEEKYFRETLVVHDLPGIYHYWSEKYLLPKLQSAGIANLSALYADPLGAACARRAGGTARFLSVGAGNCDMEIDLALTLRAAGHTNFVIDCLDLNPAMLQRGAEAAAGRGVSANIAALQADFNEWVPTTRYDGAVANQALHHVMNLEGLLDQIKASLEADACFVISDIIGRNGHLRWPEALKIIHEYWQRLPHSYRFNWQLKRYEAMFEDWDCSGDSFEGIRSQDILPLLLERFRFDKFVPYGNVIDPFVDRSFGHNFDVGKEWDRAFIDEVHARDEAGFTDGTLTPTHMFAVLDSKDEPNPSHIAACVRRGNAVDEPVSPPVPTEDRLGRILQELETERRRLSDIANLKSQEVQSLQEELVKRTEWAWGLEKEMIERTEWAMALDRRIAELTSAPAPKSLVERLFGRRSNPSKP